MQDASPTDVHMHDQSNACCKNHCSFDVRVEWGGHSRRRRHRKIVEWDVVWELGTSASNGNDPVLHTAASRYQESFSYHNTYIRRSWYPTSEARSDAIFAMLSSSAPEAIRSTCPSYGSVLRSVRCLAFRRSENGLFAQPLLVFFQGGIFPSLASRAASRGREELHGNHRVSPGVAPWLFP